MYVPVILLAVFIGSLLVSWKWTRAPREFTSELSSTELVSRIQKYRRWLEKAHPWYAAINLVALGSIPIAGLLWRQGSLPRGVRGALIVGGGLAFFANQLAVVLVPRALARHLKLYCPNCFHLFGPASQQLKSARRGECTRCHVRFTAAEQDAAGDVRPGIVPE